jgi:hypothetical protein
MSDGGWTLDTLKELMDERDKRYEQRFISSQKAIDEAKGETQKKFENTNEWRGLVTDTQKNYITRAELDPVVKQVNTCVTWPVVFAMIVTAGVIVGIVIEILNFAMFQHK